MSQSRSFRVARSTTSSCAWQVEPLDVLGWHVLQEGQHKRVPRAQRRQAQHAFNDDPS